MNSKRVEASYRVAAGDRIRIPPVRVAEREDATPAPHFKLPILFEDDALLAIDKPSGLAVHGGSGVAHGVIESLRSMRPEAHFLELVHRLDRETSGVLLVAKKRGALTALHEMLREPRHGQALPRRRGGALSQRAAARAPGARQARHRRGREARLGLRGWAGGRDGLPPASSAAPSSACSKPSCSPAARTRSACTSRRLKHPILGDDKYGDFELNKALAQARV